MNFEIVELSEFSGTKTKIYSVIDLDNQSEDLTLFDYFIKKFSETHRDEVLSILNLIEDINSKFGIRENLIKDREGKLGDGVIAIHDNPDKKLRLYGIRFASSILILGGGGVKPKNIRAWQEDRLLSIEANKLIEISAKINKRIRDKDIWFDPHCSELLGDLTFNNDNDEK